ncbi:MAG TPA: carboxypeptidase-like regulatory domain-containing protein [Candidatus Aquabacterium excrementipullorum]|nr:carboxypeptidase-like regulatory domain-containing protein [Candidatus Aquabacterium excrementipullorum]
MNKTTASAHGPQGFTQPRWLPLHQALLATALAAALAHGPAWAQAPTPASAAENANPASTPASMAQLPAARTSGKVKYLTGGVGKDESDMIKAESRHWPLTLEFAVRTQGRAQFAAGVDVLVRNAAGQEVLHAKSDGPFLLARLEPGAYTVQASLDGQAQQKSVQIEKDRPLRLLISWPPGNERAAE